MERGDGFTGAFPGETDDDDLEALRELFQRKALIARQSKSARRCWPPGRAADEVVRRLASATARRRRGPALPGVA